MIRTAHTTLQTQPQQYPRAQNSVSGSNSISAMYAGESSKTSDGKRGSEAPARVWKTAVDPKTGRTYYYDAITRETQWRKPLELASEEEKRTMARKEKKQKDFFAAMEANIMKNMAAGSLVPVLRTNSSMDGEQEEARDNIGELFRSKENNSLHVEPCKTTTKTMAPSASTVSTGKRSSNNPAGNPKLKPQPLLRKPQMVRTISSMDDNVLAELTRFEKGQLGDDATEIKRRVSPTSVSATGKENRYFERRDSASSEEGDVPSHFVQLRVTTSEEEEDLAIEEVRRVAKVMSELDVYQDSSAFSSAPAAPSSKSKSLLGKPTLAKPKMRKRNTCGTLYVGSTMSAPDKDATIKCIAGVYRAHLLQSAMDPNPPVKFEEYEIFNDWEKDHPKNSNFQLKSSHLGDALNLSYGLLSSTSDFPGCYSASSSNGDAGICTVPTLEEITNFYRDVFRKSQMESDCIIMSLIYVERLIKETNGGVRPRSCNWRSILFSAMILSSKVWDDLSMWNADFSQCVSCPPGVTFSVQRINELERAVLNCLKYNVKVSASEYAKYYFLLRSMLIRSGLAGDDLNSLSPLDVEGARQLELRSSTVPALLPSTPSSSGGGDSPGSHSGSPICDMPNKMSHSRRAKSMSDALELGLPQGCDGGGKASKGRSPVRSSHSNASARANLEQVVQM